MASVHVIKEKRKSLRERLVATGGVGPYPRALSTAWDVHARKTLAGLPAEGENGSIGVFDTREKIVSGDDLWDYIVVLLLEPGGAYGNRT